MRINKYIANCGYCSRREADRLVENKKVLVNGKLAENGLDITSEDIVEVNGERIFLEEEKVYFLLNKPLGYVSTLKDPHEEHLVIDLFKEDYRIYPVGRLDKDSFGLLLFTNDGELANKLTHPSHNVEKEYIVRVDKKVNLKDLETLSNGILLEERMTRKAKFELLNEKNNILRIYLKEGRNRQIRKMLKLLGYEVVSLERVAFGEIRLGNLEIGKYRKLSEKEVEYLRSL